MGAGLESGLQTKEEVQLVIILIIPIIIIIIIIITRPPAVPSRSSPPVSETDRRTDGQTGRRALSSGVEGGALSGSRQAWPDVGQ